MHTWFIHGLFESDGLLPALMKKVHDPVRSSWSDLEYRLVIRRWLNGLHEPESSLTSRGRQSFRRTGATLLANELGIQAAADTLGHTSTSTTKAHCAEPDRTVKAGPADLLQPLAPPA
jgi:integrase